MKKQCESYLKHCLYFAANSLARTINKMAEEEFMVTGLLPLGVLPTQQQLHQAR